MSLNEDIINAYQLINSNHHRTIDYNSCVYSFIYKFTNENISGYYDLFDFNRKKILTVCSSGDHVLEAILRGAKKVDTFDINKLTYYFMNLKLAAVLSLEYHDFVSYFYSKTNIFCEKYYQKIEKNLSYVSNDSLKFWNHMYHHLEGSKLYHSLLFNQNCIGLSFFSNKTSYLNKQYYSILREKLISYLSENRKINFKAVNVINLKDSFKETYDFIVLSNIASYMSKFYTEPCNNFYNLIVDNLNTMLNRSGTILAMYLYSKLTLPEFTDYCLNNPKFSLYPFPSLNDVSSSYMLTYKK